MTELQALVLHTIIYDLVAGTIIGILSAFAIVVLRKD